LRRDHDDRKKKSLNTKVERDLVYKSAPLYLKVVDHIKSCIDEGVWADRVLLAESHVSAILGVSRSRCIQETSLHGATTFTVILPVNILDIKWALCFLFRRTFHRTPLTPAQFSVLSKF